MVTGLASGVAKPGDWQMTLVLFHHGARSKAEGRSVNRYLPSFYLL